MQARNAQWLFGHVDASYRRTFGRHGFGEDAAAATDVENLVSVQVSSLPDVVEP